MEAWTGDVAELEATQEAVAGFVSEQRQAGKHALVGFFESVDSPGAQSVVAMGPELDREDDVVLGICYTSSPTLSLGASEEEVSGVRFFDARGARPEDWFPVGERTEPLVLGRAVKKLAWPQFKWHAEGDITSAFAKVGGGGALCG